MGFKFKRKQEVLFIMVLAIQLGILKIPIDTTNFSKNRYSVTALHQYSVCCKEEVGNKPYCKGCGKDVSKEDIIKGIDKDTILSKSQQEELKTFLEGGLMEVLGVRDITENTAFEMLPFVQKAQMILPSTSKGFKKSDIKTFYSFKSALKDLNKMCIVKLTQRNTEHIGVMMNWKEDLIMLELPFKNYNNLAELESQKLLVSKVIEKEGLKDIEGFKEQAKQFISNYQSKVSDINEVEEQKKVLLSSFIEQIKTGVVVQTTEIKQEENPFA